MPLDRRQANAVFGGHSLFEGMKAKVIITPKRAVLDPQGKTVQTALEHMGCSGVSDVRIGKYIEIEMDGDRETVEAKLSEYADKFLANPNIEDYRLVFED
jgi:phosphoribosylformylglycinamidine synthase